MKVIVFKNNDNSIAILYPAESILSIVKIEEIAKKDVPYGLPYWIVDKSIIPEDRTFRDAWEINENFGEPYGFGGKNDKFDDKLIDEIKVLLGGF